MPSFFLINPPLRLFGLTSLPAVPVTESVPDLAETLGRLLIPDQQVAQAKAGLSTPQGQTHKATYPLSSQAM